MTKLLSHSARPSRLTKVWHAVSPAVPQKLKHHIRQKSQYLHSRHLNHQDGLLLSYPKSGSTWLRSLLLSLLSEPGTGVEDLANWIPPLHMASSKRLTIPRIVRSHDSPGTLGFKNAGKMLILVRDPRALVVSYSHHQNRRNRSTTIEETTALLLSSGFDFLGSWRLHMQQGLDVMSRENVKIVRYEDLVADTPEVLASITEFYGLSDFQMSIEDAVADNNRDKLRKKRLSSGIEALNSSDVRDSTTSSWMSECPLPCQAQINAELGDILAKFGYDV